MICLDCDGKAAGVRRETKQDDMLETADRNPAHRTTGMVLHWAGPYDLLLRFVMRGKEKQRDFGEAAVLLSLHGLNEILKNRVDFISGCRATKTEPDCSNSDLRRNLHRFEYRPLNAGKLGSEILRKPINDLRSPAFGLLPVQNVPANRPVQQNELPVDGKRGAHLGGADALLDVFEEGSIARWGLERFGHRPL